jgi:serine/threonine protein phosphatase PrpC
MMEKTSFPILVSQDSDVGRSEKRFYEDRLRVENIVTKSGLQITLAVVSDGIGGENAGERAAQKTVDTIFSFCTNQPRQMYCNPRGSFIHAIKGFAEI